MSTVTYGGVHTPAATIGKPAKAKSQKGLFARFMDALMETRLREASRVIQNHAHLLASTKMLSRRRSEKR